MRNLLRNSPNLLARGHIQGDSGWTTSQLFANSPSKLIHIVSRKTLQPRVNSFNRSPENEDKMYLATCEGPANPRDEVFTGVSANGGGHLPAKNLSKTPKNLTDESSSQHSLLLLFSHLTPISRNFSPHPIGI
jgi:hypothetical protein